MSLVKVISSGALLCCLMGLPLAAQAKTFVVQTQNTSFVPGVVTIAAGDTVRWEWTSLVHTVTSGSGPSDPNVGSLFDAPLDSTHPVFIHRFTQVGSVSYFCRFHFLMGMTGTVVVQPATPAEMATWSAVKTLYR